MKIPEKIRILEDYFGEVETYADSFKGEIYCMIGDFEEGNLMLAFLKKQTGTAAIYQFIDRLNFMIVIKYDQLSESLGDFLPHRT
jgi:hypothetical protein